MRKRTPTRKLALTPRPQALVPRVDAAQRETGLQALETDAEATLLVVLESRRQERLVELDRRVACEEAIERARAERATDRAAKLAEFRTRLGE